VLLYSLIGFSGYCTRALCPLVLETAFIRRLFTSSSGIN